MCAEHLWPDALLCRPCQNSNGSTVIMNNSFDIVVIPEPSIYREKKLPLQYRGGNSRAAIWQRITRNEKHHLAFSRYRKWSEGIHSSSRDRELSAFRQPSAPLAIGWRWSSAVEPVSFFSRRAQVARFSAVGKSFSLLSFSFETSDSRHELCTICADEISRAKNVGLKLSTESKYNLVCSNVQQCF